MERNYSYNVTLKNVISKKKTNNNSKSNQHVKCNTISRNKKTFMNIQQK